MNLPSIFAATPYHQKLRKKGFSRSNSIDSQSFDNAAGVITVQQDNGNNNVVGTAMGLIANIFDVDSSTQTPTVQRQQTPGSHTTRPIVEAAAGATPWTALLPVRKG